MNARRSEVVRLCEEALRDWRKGDERFYWQAVEDRRSAEIDAKAEAGANVPWCAAFASWVFASAGAPFEHRWGTGIAYVPFFVSWGKENECWQDDPDYEPEAGDLVIYHRGGHPSHIGIVVGSELSIEGNFSGRDLHNGGGKSGGGGMAHTLMARAGGSAGDGFGRRAGGVLCGLHKADHCGKPDGVYPARNESGNSGNS